MAALTELEPLDSDRQVAIGPLYEDPERWRLTESAIESDLEVLKERGWIRFWRSLAGIGTVMVDQPGIDVAAEFSELKRNPRRRAQAIRDAVLHWLYDVNLSDGHAAAVSDFLRAGQHYFGEPFTEAELVRAAKWLMDEKYMTGQGTWGGEILRPTITSKGMKVIDNGLSVNAMPTSGGMTVNKVNVHGSHGVNIAVASSNVTQANTLSQGQIEQVEKILGSVRAMMSPQVTGVSEDVAAESAVVVGEIEDVIQSSAPEAGRVKALLFKLTELAATGTVQGAVDALNSMIQQGIGSM